MRDDVHDETLAGRKNSDRGLCREIRFRFRSLLAKR